MGTGNWGPQTQGKNPGTHGNWEPWEPWPGTQRLGPALGAMALWEQQGNPWEPAGEQRGEQRTNRGNLICFAAT